MVIQKSESVMNGFFQAFRMEVLRAIQNSFFPTTYFAILITLFLNIYLYTTTDSYVSVAYLDNIMNGRSKNPSIKMIMKIANALSISPAELINIPEINDYLKDGDPDNDSPPDSE